MNPGSLQRAGAAALALVLSGSLAHAAPPAAAPLWGTLGLATPTETADDAKAFAGITLSLPQALAAVQNHGPGRVVEIGFADDHGAPRYSALVAAGDGLHYVTVDPATGDIGKGERPDIGRDALDAVGQRDLAALMAANVSLQQAVQSVSAKFAPVIAAGVEQLNGVPQYYVQTAKDGKLGDVIVDPATGRMTPPS